MGLNTSETLAVVDPRFRIPYFTYVLQGLSDLGFRIRFRRLDGPEGNGLAMHLAGRRIWVDADDMPSIEPAPYEWADVFGKVNCTREDADRHSKVVLLGPIFGLRLWSLPLAYLKLPGLVLRGAPPKAALNGVRFQGVTRLPISDYRPGTSETGYVFHRSRQWSGKHSATNEPRARFIEAVRALGLSDPSLGLENDRVTLGTYVQLTRRSSVVFSSPAVHGCLGWKLGEYLALGKAIISTPLGRALPSPLTHGTHIHIVDDEIGAMEAAVREIDGDPDYRHHLEIGARRWYEDHLTPARVSHRLTEGASNRS